LRSLAIWAFWLAVGPWEAVVEEVAEMVLTVVCSLRVSELRGDSLAPSPPFSRPSS
jgi:hypothetical protein